MNPVLISACLLGVHSRYDGGTCFDRELVERLRREGCELVPVCPEQLGGLTTPRAPAEVQTMIEEDEHGTWSRGDAENKSAGSGGAAVLAGKLRVLTADGTDVTEQYLRGARETLRIAQLFGCRRAFLRERSPSCGVQQITRGGQTEPGRGVAAALLAESGVEVIGAEPG